MADSFNHIEKRMILNKPLSSITSFKIGGPCDAYFQPANIEDVLDVLHYCKERSIPYQVIGNGTNLLIHDNGFRGIVINLVDGLKNVIISENEIVAECGVRLTAFINQCIEYECAGFEKLAGIPGTLGGAIAMNAGAYDQEISDLLQSVTIIRDCTVIVMQKLDCGFAYRMSGLQNDVIIKACFGRMKGDINLLRIERRNALEKRNSSQPIGTRNAGSCFKNPVGFYAAKLIDEAGLKGARVGGAMVSEKHANFIVCDDHASSNDVVELLRQMKKTVHDRFGIKLDLEIKLIGFEETVLKELNA